MSTQKNDDAPSYQAQLLSKFGKRYRNRFVGKPFPTQLMMHRTFNIALIVLDAVNGLSLEDISRALFVSCNDPDFGKITQAFEAQLKLAATNPERFLFGLHQFYNDITNKIRKAGQFQEIVDFMGIYLELDNFSYNKQIDDPAISAYSNLLLHTLEYLRPEKFNLQQTLIGVSTSGEPLAGNDLFPFFDMPSFRLHETAGTSAAPKSQEQATALAIALYAEQGLDIKTAEDMAYHQVLQRTHENTLYVLRPYINEYTCDMLPQSPYESMYPPALGLELNVELPVFHELLKKRTATLPDNGVRVVVDDVIGEILEIHFKEIVKYDEVIMLYRITTASGDISGYYNTKSDFLYSIVNEADDAPDLLDRISTLILYCYAECVVKNLDYLDVLITNQKYPLSFEYYNIDGEINNVYNTPLMSHETAEGKNPDAAFLNGFIRKLPPGQAPPKEDVELAESMGYCLEADEVYVKPFCKMIFDRSTS